MKMEQYICQCCGMPLDDSTFSREPDGEVNTDYCMYCYADGKFRYEKLEDLVDFCVKTFSNDENPPEKMRAYMESFLPTLKYWKNKKSAC